MDAGELVHSVDIIDRTKRQIEPTEWIKWVIKYKIDVPHDDLLETIIQTIEKTSYERGVRNLRSRKEQKENGLKTIEEIF